MARNKLDFTDRELRIIASALSCYLYSRETFFTKGSAMVFNHTSAKIIKEGMQRKNPRSILYPLVNFDKEE